MKRKPDDNNVENVTQDKCDIKSKKKKKEKPTNQNLLSFNDEEEDVWRLNIGAKPSVTECI